MEGYKAIVALAAIKKHMDAGEMEEAYQLVRGINQRKVKGIADLSMLAEVCIQTKHYNEAKDFYQRIYSKNGSKRALAQLVYIAIKNNQPEEAMEYQMKLNEVSPDNPLRLINKFRIQKLNHAPLAEQIATLEQLKEEDYIERWAYELAKLYHKTGDSEKCIRECSDIILWFGEGDYVEWARILRGHHLGEIDVVQLQVQQDELRLAEEVKRAIGTTGTSPEEEDAFTEYADVEELMPLSKSTVIAEEGQQISGEYPEPDDIHQAAQEELEQEAMRYMAELLGQEAINLQTEEKTEAEAAFEATMPGEQQTGVEAQEATGSEILTEEVPAQPEADVTESSTLTEEVPAQPETEADKRLAETLEEAFGSDEVIKLAVQEVLREESQTEDNQTKASQPDENSKQTQDIIREENSDTSEQKNDNRKQLANIQRDKNNRFQPEEGSRLQQLLDENEMMLEDTLGNYARMESVRKQLIRALDIIFDKHKRGDNLIITGGRGSGKTMLAKKIAKLMYQLGELKTTKVALVDAERMNRIDIESKKEALMDCCLIIEEAGSLEQTTVNQLIALNPSFSGRTVVFLEDNRSNINRLLRDNPVLNQVYNNRIHLPNDYRISDLKGYVYEYFLTHDYEIDVEADALLETCLKQLTTSRANNQIQESIGIAKTVVHNAEKRTARQLADLAETGDYSNADIMIIHKEDMMGLVKS